MAQHGLSREFDPAKEDWISYTERLQHYFTANDVNDWNKQRAILLSACGPPTYQLIRYLVAPRKPTSKSFQEIVELVSKHHHPTTVRYISTISFPLTIQAVAWLANGREGGSFQTNLDLSTHSLL